MIRIAQLRLPAEGTFLFILLGDNVDNPPVGTITKDGGSSLDDLDTLDSCRVDGAEVAARGTQGRRLGDAVNEDEDATPTQGVVALVHIVARRRHSRDEVADDGLHIRQDLAHLPNISLGNNRDTCSGALLDLWDTCAYDDDVLKLVIGILCPVHAGTLCHSQEAVTAEAKRKE